MWIAVASLSILFLSFLVMLRIGIMNIPSPVKSKKKANEIIEKPRREDFLDM